MPLGEQLRQVDPASVSHGLSSLRVPDAVGVALQSPTEFLLHKMQKTIDEIMMSQKMQEQFLLQKMQKTIDEIMMSQKMQEQSLTSLIPWASSRMRFIEESTEGCQNSLRDISGKINILDEKTDSLIQRSMAPLQQMSAVDVVGPVCEEDVRGNPVAATAGVSINQASVPDTSLDADKTQNSACKNDRRDWATFRKTLKGQGHKHSRLYKDLMMEMSMPGTGKSIWHAVCKYSGLTLTLANEAPDTCLARAAYHPVFNFATSAFVMASALLMGYQTDNDIKSALKSPGAHEGEWAKTADFIFNIVFAAEVSFRILALRSWFFVAPGDWAWNMMDLCVVVFSFFSDLLIGFNLTFMRSLRLLRAVRVVRMIRVLRVFRELRKMLLAMLASVKSLLWAFVFLAMMMYMVSIVLLQGLSLALMDTHNSAEFADQRFGIWTWYRSLGQTMISLLEVFTGGAEWKLMYEPLATAGWEFQLLFVSFLLFVSVGLMNILTAMFLAHVGDIQDKDLVIQDYRIQVEGFVRMMMELFYEVDEHRSGEIDWQTFTHAIDSDRLQAGMAYYGLSPLQAGLIFDLLDEHRTGRINLIDFVFGMSRLKGYATAVDAEVMMREIDFLPQMIDIISGQGSSPSS